MTRVSFNRLIGHALAAVLAVLFLTPLTLTTFRYLKPNSKYSRWLDRVWLGRPLLSGVTLPDPEVPFSLEALRTGVFQKRKANQFNESFAGREALIRYTNELWFRLFRTAANPASTVTVGRNDVLFQPGYLEEYFITRSRRADLEPWVRDLRKLQDFCRNFGMAFVLVLTPSKASIYPEDVPPEWRRWYDQRPRAYPILSELFRDYQIEYVDAVELLVEEKKKGPAVPLFPKGGIHWNRRSAFIAANAMQVILARQNKPAEPIVLLRSTVDTFPEGEEQDLVELMNLAAPWRYPVEKLSIQPSARPHTKRMTAAIIGDSFGWSLLHVLHDSEQFSEIGFFFHYWRKKITSTENRLGTVRTPATPVDFRREIFAADCLILEVNEVAAINHENHITGFLKDALANLPDPGAPKPPFRGD